MTRSQHYTHHIKKLAEGGLTTHDKKRVLNYLSIRTVGPNGVER